MDKEKKIIDILCEKSQFVYPFYILQTIKPDIFLCFQPNYYPNKAWKVSFNYCDDVNDIVYHASLKNKGFNFFILAGIPRP